MKLLNAREWKDPKTGKVYWRVRHNDETGKECVKVFGTPEEADKHIGTVHKAREKHGRAAAANAEEIAALSIWRAFAQGELTAGRDAPSLRDAMRNTIERLKDGMTSPPLGKLRDQFLLAKQTEKVSKRHEHAMKSALKRFVSYFDALEPAGSLTTADVDKALGSMSAGGLAPQSVKNIRAIAHNLFQWALDRDLVAANPVTRTKAPKVTQGEVGTITPSQLQGFLRTALRVVPQSVPAFAVWAFCGLRRAEIARLSYEDLNQERKELRVSAKVAKTGVARFVPMPTALLEWLSAAKAAGVLPVGKLVPGELETTSEGYLCRWFRDVHKQDGLAEWPHNALRHSFASHAAAMHDDFAKVAAWLGHSRDPRLLVTRYRHAVPKRAGKAWFAVLPVDKPKKESAAKKEKAFKAS